MGLWRWVAAGTATLAGLTALGYYEGSKELPLGSVLSGERHTYSWREGDIFYQVKGSGKPLLLLHSINIGASSFEIRKNYEELAQSYRVYALDLLGFGLSDRPEMDYSARVYTDLITDFCQEVIGAPTSVIAVSLTCEFVIRSAAENPQLFDRLILVVPTGIKHLPFEPGKLRAGIHTLLRSEILGKALFAGLTTKATLAGSLAQQSYYDKAQVTPAMLEYYYAATHRPGARFALAAYLTGNLHSNISQEYTGLQQPILIVWGKQATTPVKDSRDFLELQPRAELQVIENAGLAVNDEQAGEFNRRVLSWLETAPPGAITR